MNEILGRKNKAITALIRIQLQYEQKTKYLFELGKGGIAATTTMQKMI
jgi:hypothetical protein